MNLKEFKEQINGIIKCIEEDQKEGGEGIEDINVSIQIDDYEGNSKFSDDIELHYDGDIQASGFVILGFINNPS